MTNLPEDEKKVSTEKVEEIIFVTEDGQPLVTEDGNTLTVEKDE